MLDLWDVLSKELGSAFIRQYGSPTDSSFEHWLMELWEFTPEQLFAGFDKFKAKGSTYISLNVFRSHCKPTAQELGIDGFEEAYRKVMRRLWHELHPAFPVVCAPQMMALSGMTHEKSVRRFKDIHADIVQRVAAGEQFEWQPTKALVHKFEKGVVTETNKIAAKKTLTELFKELK